MCVAEQLLNARDVHAGIQQPRCQRVAQAVGADRRDTGGLAQSQEVAIQPLVGEWLTIGLGPEGCGRGRALALQIGGEGLAGERREIDHAIALALALAHEEALARQIQILALHIEAFAGAEPAVGQDKVACVDQLLCGIAGGQPTGHIGVEGLAFGRGEVPRQAIGPQQGA